MVTGADEGSLVPLDIGFVLLLFKSEESRGGRFSARGGRL